MTDLCYCTAVTNTKFWSNFPSIKKYSWKSLYIFEVKIMQYSWSSLIMVVTLCVGFPGGVSGKEPTCQFSRYEIQGWEDPLEDCIATHSSILAWRIPWTVEPGKLQSTVSQRVGHDWSDLAPAHVLHNHCKHWINDYGTITPTGNIGLNSWEPLVTTFASIHNLDFCITV